MLKAWAVLLVMALPLNATAQLPARPGHEAYVEWLKAEPLRADRVAAFEAYLAAHNVAGVLPTEQILRSSSEWKRCSYTAFDLAPEADWPHMVKTLKFIRDEVIPAVAQVEVVSGYREAKFNACVGGAAKSAHRDFWALDMVPVDTAITRKDLIERICAAHKRSGKAYDTGLGFYSGVRFHIDSKSYRRWGADHKGTSSPCG